MRHYTTAYKLSNEEETVYFSSEKEACAYLGLPKCCVASSYRRGEKCKGYSIERIGATTHKASKSRLFKIWSGMNERCYRERHIHYPDYGGRGITVCDEWRGDSGFATFKEWAESSGYAENLTIDRIDNNKGYEPQNCRWATVKEQMNNKRRNRNVVYKGQSYTLSQLSEAIGIKITTLKERLNAGWSVEDAVEKPIRLRTRGYRQSNCGARMVD